MDTLKLITISYFQHEEALSHVSNGTKPTQKINRNNEGKQHTKNPKPILPSERALKPSKLCKVFTRALCILLPMQGTLQSDKAHF